MPYISARKPNGRWGLKYLPGGHWLDNQDHETKTLCEAARRRLQAELTDDGPPVDNKDMYREAYLRRRYGKRKGSPGRPNKT